MSVYFAAHLSASSTSSALSDDNDLTVKKTFILSGTTTDSGNIRTLKVQNNTAEISSLLNYNGSIDIYNGIPMEAPLVIPDQSRGILYALLGRSIVRTTLTDSDTTDYEELFNNRDLNLFFYDKKDKKIFAFIGDHGDINVFSGDSARTSMNQSLLSTKDLDWIHEKGAMSIPLFFTVDHKLKRYIWADIARRTESKKTGENSYEIRTTKKVFRILSSALDGSDTQVLYQVDDKEGDYQDITFDFDYNPTTHTLYFFKFMDSSILQRELMAFDVTSKTLTQANVLSTRHKQVSNFLLDAEGGYVYVIMPLGEDRATLLYTPIHREESDAVVNFLELSATPSNQFSLDTMIEITPDFSMPQRYRLDVL